MPLKTLSEIRSENAKTQPREGNGRMAPRSREMSVTMSAEVATVERAEFLSPVSYLEFPNLSSIIRHRSQGQGISFYDTMLGTDADLAGFFQNLIDDALHFHWYIRPASKRPEHIRHKQFIDYAFRQIPHFQNVKRNIYDAHARGFSVTEKVYALVDQGEWRGAVVYADLLDRPQRWFSFDKDRNLMLRTASNQNPGELLPQDKFMRVTFGSNSTPWGEPVLDLVYWAWYLKHHAMKNQALWFEKWASPTPMAEYRLGTGGGEINARRRREALEAAMAFQSDQAVAVPEGIKMQLLESTRSGAISFEAYMTQLTEMQSRIVTGQVLTSMIGSVGSYAQARVHQKEQSNKVEMLTSFGDSQISRQLIRDLIDRNFGTQDAYPRHETMSRSQAERQGEANVDQQLLANGLSMSQEWANFRYQNVEPVDANDVLTPSALIKPGQPLPVSAQL